MKLEQKRRLQNLRFCFLSFLSRISDQTIKPYPYDFY